MEAVLYNRYLAEAAADAPPLHTEAPHIQPPAGGPPPGGAGASHPPHAASAFSDLTRGLTGRLQNIKLDMDTIIVLVIVWFLLSDGDDIDWEQLLMIGALLILGI
ncbi:MAG: hypothetical protein Q4C72_03465 [Eubacteriales bacterium]|nr:hypothetical protein [Eubacteriales bacterium]